jgi:hypothetical protein
LEFLENNPARPVARRAAILSRSHGSAIRYICFVWSGGRLATVA